MSFTGILPGQSSGEEGGEDLSSLTSSVNTLQTSLALKADSSSVYSISETDVFINALSSSVLGLENDKQDALTNNSVQISHVSGLSTQLAARQNLITVSAPIPKSVVMGLNSDLTDLQNNKIDASDVYTKSEVDTQNNSLVTAIANVAATKNDLITTGSLAVSDTSGLQGALDTKATSASLTSSLALKQNVIQDGDLSIAKTSGLQGALDTKATSASLTSGLALKQDVIADGGLSIAKTAGLQSSLSSKQATVTNNSLSVSHVSGLSALISAKQPLVSSSSPIDISGVDTLQTTLDSKATSAELTSGLAGKQATISDGSLSIARTSGLQTELNSKQGLLVDNSGEGIPPMIDSTTISRFFAGDGIEISRFLNLTDTSDPKHLNIRISAAPRVFIDVYASANSANYTNNARVVPYNTTRTISDSSAFTLETGGIMLVNTTGMYSITYEVSCDVASGAARSISQVEMQRRASGNATFSTFNGTDAYVYNRSDASGESSCSCTVIRQMNSGDRLRILVRRHAGTDTLRTLANACRLQLISL